MMMGTILDKSIGDRLLAQVRRLRTFGDGPPPFEKLGISPSQLGLLEWLDPAPGSSLKDIAEGLGVSSPNVSVVVRKLEEAGLVERQSDPEDGRALLFSLTRQGESLLRRVREYRRAKAGALLSGLSPDEMETLVSLLEKAMSKHKGGQR